VNLRSKNDFIMTPEIKEFAVCHAVQ
jgi:hypothetical protein